MNRCPQRLHSTAGILALSILIAACETGRSADLKDAVPADCFIGSWGQRNPERDFLEDSWASVLATIEETQIVDKFLRTLREQIPADGRERLDAIRNQLQTAVAPVDWSAVAEVEEVAWGMKIAAPSSQQVLFLRCGDGGAKSLADAATNLMRILENATEGTLTVQQASVFGADLSYVPLPPESGQDLVVGVMDENVFIFSTKLDMLKDSLRQLQDSSATSYFDDPRLAHALTHLPQPEDGLVFFDGRRLIEQLQSYPEMIRRLGQGNAGAEKAARLFSRLVSEFDAVDYEVSVQSTEGFQIRQATFGRLQENADTTVLWRMAKDQKPFDAWHTWVPETATGWSLNSGVSLHPLYEMLMNAIPEAIPEAADGFARFAALQDQFGVHLDEDILQSFSGESVSLTFPGTSLTPFGSGSQSVSYLRCSQPDTIRELMHRGVEAIRENPQARALGLDLRPVDGMDGFEELTMQYFAMMGIRPVIGFEDGWMVLASHRAAVENVRAVRNGDAASILNAERFQKFNFPVDGPVYSVKYANTGESIRQAAVMLQQGGAMAPLILSTITASGDGPDLSAVSDFLALLPAVGRIIGSLDFYDSTLSVTQPGPEEKSWMRHTVTLIRPPADSATTGSTTTAHPRQTAESAE